MKRILIPAGLTAAVSTIALLALSPSPTDTVSAGADESWAASIPEAVATTSTPVALGPPALQAAYEPAYGRTAFVESSDSCNLVREKLTASRAALTAAEVEREALRAQVGRLERELKLLTRELLHATKPEDTPGGAFLRSYEAEAIHDPKLLKSVCSYIEVLPVFFRPGEATWVADRLQAKDWKLYATTSERALIQFLGVARLKEEIPEERLAELRADYADDGLFD